LTNGIKTILYKEMFLGMKIPPIIHYDIFSIILTV
jgi:hypothetical protein